MKKVLTLAAVTILCFVLGTAGIYLAMPSLSPEKVQDTRARLDSLGLLTAAPVEPPAAPMPALDTLRADSTDSTTVSEVLPSAQDIIRGLRDSIAVSQSIIQSLTADTSTLSARVAELTDQVDELTQKDFEASELSKSLAKLDARQLGSILAGLEIESIEMIYEKASARDRTRLLESMSPEQAARFVRTLVQGPEPAPVEDEGAEPADDAPPIE